MRHPASKPTTARPFRPSPEEARKKAGNASAPGSSLSYAPTMARHIMQLQRTIGNRAVQRMVASHTGTSGLIQREIPEGIKKDDNVFYKDGMKEAEGRALMQRITTQDKSALDGLSGDELMLDYYKTAPSRIFSQEWGLGLDRTDPGGEVVIISGGKTGVRWGPYLEHLIPLAHSHPYEKSRQIKNNFVPFDQISGDDGEQKMMQRLLIFPSAGDVEFSAYQGVADHTVFTPYSVLTHPQSGKKAIANPGHFDGAPPLSFTILNAVQDTDNPKHYRCTLIAREKDTEFWRKDDVLADLTKGPQSTLYF